MFYLSNEKDKKELEKVLDKMMIEELLAIKVQSLMLNQVSTGLLICDADRALDVGRGYVSMSDYPEKSKKELWDMVILRAYSALLCKESFNPIDEGHEYGGLKYWANYLSAARNF